MRSSSIETTGAAQCRAVDVTRSIDVASRAGRLGLLDPRETDRVAVLLDLHSRLFNVRGTTLLQLQTCRGIIMSVRASAMIYSPAATY